MNPYQTNPNELDQLQRAAQQNAASSFGGQIMQMVGQPDKNPTPPMGMPQQQQQQQQQYGVNEKGVEMAATMCCFIFLEAYDGALPATVRRWRDYYYAKFPRIAKGYRRMAAWLVPMMRVSSRVKTFVQRWMTRPITRAGKSRDNGKFSWTFIVAYLWLAVWYVYGTVTFRKEAE